MKRQKVIPGEKDRIAYKRYMLIRNPFRDEWYIMKDNFNIGGPYRTAAEAKADVDMLVD